MLMVWSGPSGNPDRKVKSGNVISYNVQYRQTAAEEWI